MAVPTTNRGGVIVNEWIVIQVTSYLLIGAAVGLSFMLNESGSYKLKIICFLLSTVLWLPFAFYLALNREA